jgi:hypothetical protein
MFSRLHQTHLHEAANILYQHGHRVLSSAITEVIEKDQLILNWKKTVGFSEYKTEYKGYCLRMALGSFWEGYAHHPKYSFTVHICTTPQQCEKNLLSILDILDKL